MFLDRDGVINEDVFYPRTGEWEAPLAPCDLVLRPGVLPALRRLQALGFMLVLVSNQAAFAKGKVPLADLMAVHDRFANILTDAGIAFTEFCYSYSHPSGVVPGFSGPSLERKPGIYFPIAVAARHDLALERSWMVGDRDTDILCGRNAGVTTILVANPRAGEHAGKIDPDFRATDLMEAVDIIARHVQNQALNRA